MPLAEYEIYPVNYTDKALFVLEQFISVWSPVRAPRLPAEMLRSA